MAAATRAVRRRETDRVERWLASLLFIVVGVGITIGLWGSWWLLLGVGAVIVGIVGVVTSTRRYH